ncbi:MAG TPA: MBL fold protein, partial [Dialister sp.]|nr:MBL fold protein [Dialister sp.]
MHIFQKLYKIFIAFILSVSVGLVLSGCGGSTAAS